MGRRTNNPKLTQYGQNAQQDGYQGVDAHSHLTGAGFALRDNPPGVASAGLQKAAREINTGGS